MPIVMLLVLIIIFSTRIQTLIFNSVQLAGIVGQGIWNRFMVALAIGWKVARVALVVLVILWFVNLLLFWSVGIYAKSPWSGFILGLIVPTWSMLYILKRVPHMASITKIPWVVTTAILVLVLPAFFLGLWSPSVKEGYDQWSDSKKEVLASFFKKSSFKASAEADMIVTLNDRSEMYDDKGGIIKRGKEVLKLKKGMAVKVCEKRPAGDQFEALVKVMIENPAGSFVKGNVVYIPSRKINWNQS